MTPFVAGVIPRNVCLFLMFMFSLMVPDAESGEESVLFLPGPSGKL